MNWNHREALLFIAKHDRCGNPQAAPRAGARVVGDLVRSGRFCCALLVMAGCISAQAATFTWTGGSEDWFNPNNWTPAGVPASGDTVNFSSGTINLTAPVTINAGTVLVQEGIREFP
jgi:hypothetical protein